MDILSDKSTSNDNRQGPFLAVLHTGLGIVRLLIGFFTLTQEDRLIAGIYDGRQRE